MAKILINAGIPETKGGVLSCIKTIIGNLPPEHYAFSLLYYADSPLPDYENTILNANPHTTIYRVPAFSMANLLNKTIINAIDKLFSEQSFDIIHSHDTYASFFVFSLAKKHQIPHRIMHSHNSQYSDTFLKSKRNQFLYSLTRPNINQGLACSKLAGDFLFKNQSYQLIYNGIDCQKYQYDEQARIGLRQELDISEDKIVIGNVASFIRVKNQTFMLEIIKSLDKNYLLLLVGSGDRYEEIANLVITHKLQDKVKLLGQRQDTHKLLSVFDVFILPSLFEGFPISLMEAQASGLPCLVSNHVTQEIAITDLVQFLPIENPQLWQQAITNTSIKANNRQAYANIMAEKGFDESDFSKNLDHFYQKLIQN